MFLYLLKRILLFAPTLLLVSLLSFGLSKCSPGDPVVQYLGEDVFVKYSTPQDLVNAEKSYLQAAKDLGIDRPAFYCSVRPLAYPDTLYRIVHAQRRTALEKLTAQYGNWPQVQAWQGAIRSFDLQLLGLTDSLQRATSTPIKQPLRELYLLHEHGAISARLQELEAAFGKTPALATSLGTAFFTLKKSYETMRAEATPGKLWLPALHWYGLDNQYHRWLTRFFRGDFGVSLEKLPVAQKVKPALFWTLVVSLPAIVLAFLLAVPIGAWSAVKRGKAFDKIATTTVFMLYSMPVFWVATLLLVFFTNREYGMNIFPG
ncbi:MAG: ABC transporter permease subunit, partial [Saprospiraceae bacterium]|nr:ABC transporter permease subunit [Saprospiraceae bacterium]